MKKQSQKQRVLNYILINGSLDRVVSVFQLGIFELSARICELERDGWKFTKDRKSKAMGDGHMLHYTLYTMYQGEGNA